MAISNKNDEAHRRLLDMLDGWISRSANEEEEDAIAELYQMAGNLDDNSGSPPSLIKIEDFIKDNVIPFILNGVKK